MSVPHGSKVNPQGHYSAVAEAVALADAEEKGTITDFRSIPPPPQNFVRRNPSSIAAAVALAGAEETQKINDFRSIPPAPQNVVRRNPSNRPLSTIIAGSIQGVDQNGGSSDMQTQRRIVPTRKPRPSSMALIAPIQSPPQCFYCLEEAKQLCNWCREVYYCGPNHYQMHRGNSKCLPFKAKG